MGIFLITATNEEDLVEAAIKSKVKAEDWYRLSENPAWFVVFPGTTVELSSVLRITEGESGSAVIVPVHNYYGRASKDLWEWLATRMERS